MSEVVTIIRPDDWHVHFRWAFTIDAVKKYTARVFGRALVMPNVVVQEDQPGVTNAHLASAYQNIINGVGDPEYPAVFESLMTIMLTPATTPEVIIEAKDAGILAAKYYPAGVTTGSAGGVDSIETILPALETMERVKMVLSVHGEMPGTPPLEAEEAFIPVLGAIVESCPHLPIVMEHISTKALLNSMMSHLSVVGTVTPHHLLLTINDVPGRPHHYCKPVANSAHDRDALIEAVCDKDNACLFFGSDSAPHERRLKECSESAAGIFSSPVALPALWQVFLQKLGSVEAALEPFQNFTARNGADLYGVPVSDQTIQLVQEPWRVPECISYAGLDFVPFLAGQELEWRVRTG